MINVTNLCNEISIPRTGLIPKSCFEEECLNDNMILHVDENLSPAMVGLTVDYLTRFMIGASRPFDIAQESAAVLDALKIHKYNNIGYVNKLIKSVKGLDDISIDAVAKLSAYDVVIRRNPREFKPAYLYEPNKNTCENIRIMTKRAINLLQYYNKSADMQTNIIFQNAFDGVIVGDADYIVDDILWDMKVSKNNFTSKQVLQIILYYLMSQNCDDSSKYKNLRYIGLLNPRKYQMKRVKVSDIPQNIIDYIMQYIEAYKHLHNLRL